MNKVEYLIELIKRDVEQVKIAEEDVQAMKLRLLVDLKRLEEKCEMYEEMYEDDNDLVMSAYMEYEHARQPLTQLEEAAKAHKLILIDHYEEFLKEKKEFDADISKSLNIAKYNVCKMEEVVEMIKGVFN